MTKETKRCAVPYMLLVGALFVLGACSNDTVSNTAAFDQAPTPSATEPAAPAPTPTTEPAAPTAVPEPTATPVPTATPTPTPVPTPDAITLTAQSIAAAGEMIPNAVSTSLDNQQAGREFILLCPGVPQFGPDIPRALRTTAVGSPQDERFQSVLVFLFTSEQQARDAARAHLDGILQCFDPDGTQFERDGNFARGTTPSGVTNTYAVQAVGQRMIRVITEAPDQGGHDAALLMSAALAGRPLETLQPAIDIAVVQSIVEARTASNVTVVDEAGDVIGEFDQAVLTDDDDAFGDLGCEAPVSTFDDFWFRGTVDDFVLVCGTMLPLDFIDPITGEVAETRVEFINNTCPEDSYTIEPLEIPLIRTDVAPAPDLTLQSTNVTVLGYQCVRS